MVVAGFGNSTWMKLRDGVLLPLVSKACGAKGLFCCGGVDFLRGYVRGKRKDDLGETAYPLLALALGVSLLIMPLEVIFSSM